MPTLPVDYLPGARRDFDESFDWYVERSAQAAIQFANAVGAALLAIAKDPTRFVAVDRVHRGCPVKKFPFRVVYRVVEDRVLVVAIAHAKRRPGYWKRRR
jgi:plasmid stabilization system protein ParE